MAHKPCCGDSGGIVESTGEPCSTRNGLIKENGRCRHHQPKDSKFSLSYNLYLSKTAKERLAIRKDRSVEKKTLGPMRGKGNVRLKRQTTKWCEMRSGEYNSSKRRRRLLMRLTLTSDDGRANVSGEKKIDSVDEKKADDVGEKIIDGGGGKKVEGGEKKIEGGGEKKIESSGGNGINDFSFVSVASVPRYVLFLTPPLLRTEFKDEVCGENELVNVTPLEEETRIDFGDGGVTLPSMPHTTLPSMPHTTLPSISSITDDFAIPSLPLVDC